VKQLLRSFLLAGAGVSALFGQAEVEIFAEVERDLVPIENGDITSGDPGQFFGVVDGGVVDGETPSTRIRYQLKNSGDKLLSIDLERTLLTPGDFRLVGFPDPANKVWTVQPNETKNFSIEFIPSTQSSGAIFELRNVQSAGVAPILFQFAVSGQGNLGEPEVFYLLNETERDIPNGDDNPSFNKGTNFGDVLVGESVTNSLRIRHAGTSGDTLKVTGANISGADAGSFSVINLNGHLNDGQQKVFGVSFLPQSAGEKTATVRFSTNDPNNSTYTFAVRGVGEPEVGILVEGRNGSSGDFRLISDGASASAGASNGTFFLSTFDGQSTTNTFRITNTGDAELTLSGGGVSSPYSATAIPASLDPDESAEFSITFTPTEEGSFSKNYAFLTNLPGNLSLFSFSLSGNGLGPEGPELSVERENSPGVYEPVTTSLWSYDPLFEGDPPVATPNFRIRNTGNQTLRVTSFSLAGNGAEQVAVINPSSFPIDVGVGQVSPEFHFTLTPTIPNLSVTSINVRFLAGSATADYQLRATRIIPGSSMTVMGKPEDGAFAPVGSGGIARLVNGTAMPTGGGGPVTSTFRITNTHASEDLLFGAAELSGAHADDFSITGFSTANLAPGATRDFTVTFNSAESTERTATLTFLSNDFNVRNFEINLLGNAPEVEEEIEPAVVSFAIVGTEGRLSVVTDPAKNYRLRRSVSMTNGSWADVPGVPLINGSTVVQEIVVVDLLAPGQLRYFYRIEEE